MAISNKVLVIVDDDDDIVALLKRILAATGMTIITFKSGKDFLENLIRIKTRIGILFIDLNMPSINGLVVLKKLQEVRKFTNFKACVISAYNDPAVIAKATELGADAFLIKPLDKEAILIKTRDLLRSQNISTGDDNFGKVEYTGVVLHSPVILPFNIVGINPEKILIESIFSFKEDSEISFSSAHLCHAMNYEKEFLMRVVKSVAIRTRFRISTNLIGNNMTQSQNLKSFIAQNIHEEISFYDDLGN